MQSPPVPISIAGVVLAMLLRSPAYWTALALRSAVLASFVLIWGEGVPTGSGAPMHEQFAKLDSVLLALLLPWVALRGNLLMVPGQVATMSVVTALPPAQLVTAASLALGVTLTAFAISALPVYLLVWLLAGLPPGVVLSSCVTLAALTALAATLAPTLAMLSTSRLAVWIGTSAVMLMTNAISPPEGLAAMAYPALGLVLHIVSTRIADSTAVYTPGPSRAGTTLG